MNKTFHNLIKEVLQQKGGEHYFPLNVYLAEYKNEISNGWVSGHGIWNNWCQVGLGLATHSYIIDGCTVSNYAGAANIGENAEDYPPPWFKRRAIPKLLRSKNT